MANNPQGSIDKDLQETQSKLAPFLPPNDEATFNFAICSKEMGEMTDLGGCHKLSSMYGWPAIGYMFRKEVWGQGLATEFLHAWLGIWRRLPRAETDLVVDLRTLPDGGGPALEQVTSFTVSDNAASQRVLEKCGFEQFLTQREPDLSNPDLEVVLRRSRYFPAKR